MFRSSQILTRNALLKHFKEIAEHLKQYPQPLLITQRNGEALVLVNAEIFEDLLERSLPEDARAGQNSRLKEQLAFSK